MLHLCLALLLLALAPSDSLILSVEPFHIRSGEECVFEKVEKDNKLVGSFEVVSGVSGFDVTVFLYVTGPTGETYFSSEKVRSTQFTVMAPTTGLYKVCLVNKDREEKSVAVRAGSRPGVEHWLCGVSLCTPSSLLTPPPPLASPPPLAQLSLRVGDDLFQTIAKQEHITPLETEITQLSDGISRIEDEQQYMWAREKHTAETNASTNSRVLWFSVGEAVVLIGLGVWWVITLRSFFERKGKA